MSKKVDEQKIERFVAEVVGHAIRSYYHDPETYGWLFHPMLDITNEEREALFEKMGKINVEIENADVAVILVKQEDSGGIVVQPEYPANMEALKLQYPDNPVFYLLCKNR